MASELKSRKKPAAKKQPAKKAAAKQSSPRRPRPLTLDERLLQLVAMGDKFLRAGDKALRAGDKALQAGDKALRAGDKSLRTANKALRVAQANRRAMEAAERKTDKKADRALRLADKSLEEAKESRRAAEADRDRFARLEQELVEGKGHRGNLALALEQEFATGLPRAMAAHGILIAAADVQRRVRRSPERLEYDFVAPNGEVVLVGEVKTRLRVEDVLEMVGRLKRFRTDYPEYAELKLHGVVAGWAVDDAALAMAKEEGFFVLRMDGAEIHPALGKNFNPAVY